MTKRTRVALHGTAEARALHRECPPIDLHADTLMWARWMRYDMSKTHRPLLPRDAWFGQSDLPRMRSAGMGAQFYGLVSIPWLRRKGCAKAVHRQIDRLEDTYLAHPELLVPARSAADAVRARDAGRIAAFLGIEGAHALEGDIDNVSIFARRGVRYLGLAHFSANEVCCPSGGTGVDTYAGLTRFGREVVRACEADGVIVDLAHINRKGFMQTCLMSTQPVIVSHTGVAGVYEHWRNVDDEQLRAVSRTGGVVGVIFVPMFLGGRDIGAVTRHLRHIVNVCGEDHVALGSDYDGMVACTPDLSEVSKLPNLTAALLDEGWPASRLRKLLRDNVLRVLNDVPPRHR